MLALLRRLFGICDHDWRFERTRVLNEFGPAEETEDEFDRPSEREFEMYRCAACRKTRLARSAGDR